MSLSQELQNMHAGILETIRRHPFLEATADGTISDEAFHRWLVQDYLWLGESERFLALLAAHAPPAMRRAFFEEILNRQGTIELFEEMASRNGVPLERGEMTLGTHAYSSFLLATAGCKSFAEGLASCYAAEYSYAEAWAALRKRQERPSPWQEFIDLWSGEPYRDWVDRLATMVDRVQESTEPAPSSRIAESFRLTLMFEIRFWDMTFHGTDW